MEKQHATSFKNQKRKKKNFDFMEREEQLLKDKGMDIFKDGKKRKSTFHSPINHSQNNVQNHYMIIDHTTSTNWHKYQLDEKCGEP